MSLALNQSHQISGLTEKLSSIFIVSQSKISTFITTLFVCLSAWVLGDLIWYVGGEQANVPKWSSSARNITSTTAAPGADVSNLLDFALFGQYSEKIEKAVITPVIKDAPKTRLNLVLVGAVSSSIPENSLAVIANSGTQTTYGIGEKIEGTQAKLKGVFVDRVIIDNAGRDETLMLEGIEYKKAPKPESKTISNTSARGVGNNPSSAEKEMNAIKAEVLEDPQKILQYIRLSQVKKDGALVGYRIRPGRQRALFDSVGLKNGDIATSLNGEDLTDPASMGKIWQSMSEMTEFSLTVERNGQAHEVYIAF